MDFAVADDGRGLGQYARRYRFRTWDIWILCCLPICGWISWIQQEREQQR